MSLFFHFRQLKSFRLRKYFSVLKFCVSRLSLSLSYNYDEFVIMHDCTKNYRSGKIGTCYFGEDTGNDKT